jgi:hypothetical protein
MSEETNIYCFLFIACEVMKSLAFNVIYSMTVSVHQLHFVSMWEVFDALLVGIISTVFMRGQ